MPNNPRYQSTLPYRSECRCTCHSTGDLHILPCCQPDPSADTLRALVAERDAALAREARLREALDECECWVTAALECKHWIWDLDQHAAATSSRDAARAALAGIADAE